ncbi:periplasmic binding component of a glutamate/aspartate transporter [Buttiauxella ferragutiae ATCC 51602]|jgi:glutamate/aspartate transport system substrate-binding protein|uniref:Periplasmic binding component of a glutamate/aspartate transporter n=1 Tax=Buttiauxella ferragutiae ATCC 51602 TaxID=1354252 RepID=A0ABX2W488_9ENTR|nr:MULTISPECIES: transporter substrate-binding domain-containing protein [Buttiauxella]OAT25465.1 periplasmic binding component of a glutamate/aspartate transporter [Buttiauxella ferragutiae ATCC 51602]TDN48242.1 glutamate/aspartate transport system substrate-binding protein [Buttiauxella sp. JUb87]
MKKMSFLTYSLSFLFVCYTGLVHANSNLSTLQNISARKMINIGYRDAAPYSYKTSDGHVIGYVIDLCRDVTESLKKELHISNLAVNYVPVPLTMRTTMLNHNIIDMDCSVNTDTVKRASLVLFSRHYLSVSTRAGMQAGNSVHTYNDLAGKTISVARGSSDLVNLNQLNRLQKLNILILSQPTMKESFDMMSNHKCFAAAMNEVSLRELIENSGDSSQYAVSDGVFGPAQNLGIMLRHDDTEFKKIIDKTLLTRFERPDFKQFYEQWFNHTLPGKNINLHIPLTSSMYKYLTQKES